MLLEKKFTHNNLNMTYYELGNGPTLLFIHGVGIRAQTYKKSLITLSQSFHVIAPDLPGFGASDMPPFNWNFENYSNFLNEFIKSLRIDKLIVVGHSLGGRIALSITSSTPNVSNLILIDSSPFANYYTNSKFHLVKLIFNTLSEILSEMSPSYALIAFDNLLNLKNHNFSYLKLRLTLNAALKIDSDEASKIHCPTLILWGDKDKVIPPKYAYIIQKAIKNSKVKIISGNHGWCFTKPELLHTEISNFVFNHYPS